MRALVKEEAGVHLKEVAIPIGGTNDVLIRVAFAGVCRTDLYVAEGRLNTPTPLILGHEFSGIVEQAPSGLPFAPGDPVAIIPQIRCGDCALCTSGESSDPPRCLRPQMLGVQRNGAFADYVAVPAWAV